MIVKFGEYLPDIPRLGNPGCVVAKNVYRYSGGYRPIGSFSRITQNAPGRVLGSTSQRQISGQSATFIGTRTGLYWLNVAAWADRSKVGGYSLVDGARWDFVRFNDVIVAVAEGAAPQKWDLSLDPSSGSNLWADCGGSPPQFRHIATVGGHAIGGYEIDGVNVYDQGIRWCQRNDIDSWTIGTNGADRQDLRRGGPVRRVIGGDYGVIMQPDAIHRMTLTADATIVFQIDEVEYGQGRGAIASGAVVQHGGNIYYLSEDGFFMFNGVESSSIGHGKVDKTFKADVAMEWIDRISSAVDPYNKLIIWAYVSRDNQSADPYPDKALALSYQTGEWSTIDFGESIELIASMTTETMTFDGFDSLFNSLDDVYPDPDDPIWTGGVSALAFYTSSDHRAGVLKGDPMETEIVSGEVCFNILAELGEDRSATTRTVRPLVDGLQPAVAIGTRDNQRDDISWSDAVEQNDFGLCPVRKNGRYHSVKLTSSRGENFDAAIGADVEFHWGGKYGR